MQLPEALILVNRLIDTGDKHQDYDRTVELAKTYKVYITGIGIEEKLRKIDQREDEALFKQRCNLTKSITPAIASSVRAPFNKVTRNDRIREQIKLKNEGRNKIVDGMIKTFFGSPLKKNRGLKYWMKTRFVELEFIDPNTWVVIEWAAAASPSEAIKPRPFEVSADQAVNFFVVNDEVKWLFVQQPIKFMSINGGATASVGAPPGSPSIPGVVQPAKNVGTKTDGVQYTLYDEDVTVVFQQVDPAFLKVANTGIVQPDSQLVKIKDAYYQVLTSTPNVGYPPVFRIGYKRDEATKGRTFVNPWHDALCYFDKSLKTVSELDLTMTLHAFPQKIQYVQKCQGISREKTCRNGRVADGSECTACKGSGYKLHTTAQDAILLPMPDGKEDALDLDKLLVYKAPPIDLVKFQNEYTQQLERQAHQAVYNSQVFIKKAGQPGATGQPIQTATEADFNMQSVYDALEPFTEKYSEIWRDFVMTFGILAGEQPENIEVIHEFPADYKLKTGDILLGERKTATDSGAPAFLIEAIDDDLATIIYAGDDLGLQKYRVKRRYAPFIGNTPDEIAQLLTSEWVPKEPKVLFSNFDLIFKEIAQEKPEFYTMPDTKAQRLLVEAKTTEFIARLDAQKPVISINPLGDNNPLDDQQVND